MAEPPLDDQSRHGEEPVEHRAQGILAPTIDIDAARATGHNPLPVQAMQIETSSICNFRCASCALSLADYDRPEKHMTAEQFGRVLDQFPTVEKVELQGLGEAFLNPEVIDIVRAGVARGVKVHTFSNASRIDRGLAFELVEAGLELINFSMDGADEDTFKRLRKGGTLARYRECVQNLMEARTALGSATPVIGVMSVLSKANLHQVPQLVAIAESLGVDHLQFTKLNAAVKPDQEPIVLDDDDIAWAESLPAYRGRMQVNFGLRSMTTEERMDCYWPKHMTYVTVEGEVTPCCNHFDSRELSFGNVFESTGEEIWNGEPYKAFRRALWAGNLPKLCRTC